MCGGGVRLSCLQLIGSLTISAESREVEGFHNREAALDEDLRAAIRIDGLDSWKSLGSGVRNFGPGPDPGPIQAGKEHPARGCSDVPDRHRIRPHIKRAHRATRLAFFGPTCPVLVHPLQG